MEKVKKLLTSNNFKVVIIIFCLSILACAPYLNHIAIEGNDVSYHMNRIIAISEELKAGTFPILIHSNILEGFGYASPLFYPELFLYFPAMLMCLGLSISLSYKIFIFVLTFLTGIITYYCCKYIFKDSKKAFVITLLYVLAEYRLGGVFIRCAVGEILSFMFLPIVITGLYEIIYGENKKWYIISIGLWGLLYSHIISCFLIILLIIGICLLNIKKIFTNKKIFINLLIAGSIAILFSFGWLFTYIEQLSNDSFFMQTADNAILIKEQSSTFQDLLSIDMGKFGISFSKGILLFFLPLLILKCPKTEENKFVYHLFILGLIFTFMTLEYFPWDIFTCLHIIQFPWRFAILTTILMCIVSGYAVTEVFKNEENLLIILLIISLLAGHQLYRLRANTTGAETHEVLAIGEIGLGEYKPTGFHRHPYEACDVNNTKIIYDFKKSNNQYELEYNKDYNLNIQVPLTYYKGYQAIITDENGQVHPLTISKNPSNAHIALSSNELINGTITIKYVMTPIQATGYTISWLSFISFLTYIIITNKKERKKLNP